MPPLPRAHLRTGDAISGHRSRCPDPSGHVGPVTHSPGSAGHVPIPSRGRCTELQPKQQKQARGTQLEQCVSEETGGFFLCLEQHPGGRGPGTARSQPRPLPAAAGAALSPRSPAAAANGAPGPSLPGPPRLTKPPERPQNSLSHRPSACLKTQR